MSMLKLADKYKKLDFFSSKNDAKKDIGGPLGGEILTLEKKVWNKSCFCH